MDKITVVCHKDHDKGYEEFQGKCLLCVVDELMLEMGTLVYQLNKKKEWVGLTDEEREQFRKFGFVGVLAVENKLREKNG